MTYLEDRQRIVINRLTRLMRLIQVEMHDIDVRIKDNRVKYNNPTSYVWIDEHLERITSEIVKTQERIDEIKAELQNNSDKVVNLREFKDDVKREEVSE